MLHILYGVGLMQLVIARNCPKQIPGVVGCVGTGGLTGDLTPERLLTGKTYLFVF